MLTIASLNAYFGQNPSDTEHWHGGVREGRNEWRGPQDQAGGPPVARDAIELTSGEKSSTFKLAELARL